MEAAMANVGKRILVFGSVVNYSVAVNSLLQLNRDGEN
jgi:hypothetical protein